MAETDFTRWLSKLVPEKDGEPNLTLRKMLVATVNGDGTLDLTSSGVSIPGVPRLDSVSVIAGDRVQVLTGRGMMLVLGPVGAPATRSWTPTFTATGTPPTIGTGGTVTGSYRREGGLVIATVDVVFGSSGVNAGVGDYRFTGLPAAPSSMLTATGSTSAGSPVGNAVIRNAASAGNSTSAVAQLVSSTTFMLIAPGNSGSGGGIVGAGNPWTWTANCHIHATLIYPAAT